MLERHTRADDCSDMEPSIQYRTFAEECHRLAQSAKTVEERKVLQEMEAIWTKLAAEEANGKSS
jgi:hypothetical protein